MKLLCILGLKSSSKVTHYIKLPNSVWCPLQYNNNAYDSVCM